MQSPFEQLRREMQDISGDGGVLKKVVTQGVGAEVPEGAIVRVHYNGYLEYSDEPYDSSRLRDKQQRFRLGEGRHIVYISGLFVTTVGGLLTICTGLFIICVQQGAY